MNAPRSPGGVLRFRALPITCTDQEFCPLDRCTCSQNLTRRRLGFQSDNALLEYHIDTKHPLRPHMYRSVVR